MLVPVDVPWRPWLLRSRADCGASANTGWQTRSGWFENGIQGLVIAQVCGFYSVCPLFCCDTCLGRHTLTHSLTYKIFTSFLIPWLDRTNILHDSTHHRRRLFPCASPGTHRGAYGWRTYTILPMRSRSEWIYRGETLYYIGVSSYDYESLHVYDWWSLFIYVNCRPCEPCWRP